MFQKYETTDSLNGKEKCNLESKLHAFLDCFRKKKAKIFIKINKKITIENVFQFRCNSDQCKWQL